MADKNDTVLEKRIWAKCPFCAKAGAGVETHVNNVLKRGTEGKYSVFECSIGEDCAIPKLAGGIEANSKYIGNVDSQVPHTYG